MQIASKLNSKHLIALPRHIRCKSSILQHSQAPTSNFPANYLQIQPTSFLSQLLKQRPPLRQVEQIHARIITQFLSSHPPLISSLIHCYLSCQNLNSARILFFHYPSRSPPTLLWNLMIKAHSKIQNCLESLKYFSQMLSIGQSPLVVVPDDYSYTFVVTSCSRQNSPIYGQIVHGLVVKNGFESHLFVANSLVNMYAVFGQLNSSQQVYDHMPERDVFSWNSLLGGFLKHGKLDKACDFFSLMPQCNDVSWTVMISGLVANEKYVDALDYFQAMLKDDSLKPNEAILVCTLSACANLGALDQGNWIHVYMCRNGIPESPNICTALIDMYAKCGRINCAIWMFNRIPGRDVHNFTSMISGLSIHGLGKDALDIFSLMLSEGVKPNDITILGVLKGCSHSGLVTEGTSVFYDMERLWGLVPKIEHYGCYVDLLGRAGHLEKAFHVAKTMPLNPDIAIWRALLSACRIHRNVNLAERIISHVRALNADGQQNGQVLLSNSYAYLGEWHRVIQVRNQMGGRRRNPSDLGRSWIEVNGVVHEFRVDDQLHPQISQVREKLNDMLKAAKLRAYIANPMQVTFDLSEEDKEQAVAHHSEKLAVAFGLLSTKPGSLIRIVKNLRTCEDCHLALKAISLVFEREIVVRDRSRFHTFKEGRCSCNDFW